MSGVRRAYTVLFAYIFAMMDELGTEKALTTLSKVVQERGETDGKDLVKRLRIQGEDIESGLAVYSAFLSEGGIQHEITEKTEDKALVKIEKCPIYDAYYSTGVPCDWLVETMCKTVALPLITSVIKQVHPRLRSTVKRYRSYSEDYCLEEISFE